MLVVFTAFLLANLPASVFVLWLVPGVAQLEAAAWLILALIAVVVLRGEGSLRESWAGLATAWMLLPLVLYSGLSSIWSVDWQVSLARWIVLCATIFVGGWIGLRLDPKRIARHLGVYCSAFLFISVMLVLFAPHVGVMNYYDIQGAWKGIYWHKNHMGLLAAFACTVFLVNGIGALQMRTKSSWAWAVLYLLSLFFVVQTDSVAAYLTLIVMHGLILLLVVHQHLRKRLKPLHYGAAALILVLVIAAIGANLDRVFGAFNRNTSLTGRVPMWGHLFDIYLSERPLFGYGFNAFWHIESYRVTMGQVAGYPDPIVIADNGFIDLLVNTGYVGLALFLVFYVGLWWRSARYAWNAVDIHGLFPLITMAYILIANLTWSLIFENEGFFMLIMIALLFSMTVNQETGERGLLAIGKPSTERPRDRADSTVSA